VYFSVLGPDLTFFCLISLVSWGTSIMVFIFFVHWVYCWSTGWEEVITLRCNAKGLGGGKNHGVYVTIMWINTGESCLVFYEAESE
jgi:hypothetical protein